MRRFHASEAKTAIAKRALQHHLNRGSAMLTSDLRLLISDLYLGICAVVPSIVTIGQAAMNTTIPNATNSERKLALSR
jgi:hypothetical protein